MVSAQEDWEPEAPEEEGEEDDNEPESFQDWEVAESADGIFLAKGHEGDELVYFDVVCWFLLPDESVYHPKAVM
jgi:hypothetical protein